jgi:hypothetical protein
MIALLTVMAPVVETVLLALAFAVIVTVFEARESVLMVVPIGIPVPAVRGCPTTKPVVVAGTSVMFGLPLVRMPLNAVMVVDALEERAFTAAPVVSPIEILVPMFVMYVGGLVGAPGIPGPVMGCPVASPAVLPTGVMVLLPAVTMALN